MNYRLRPWTIYDLESLVKYANNYKVSKNMSDQFPYPYTVENGKSFIEFANQDFPIHYFAIDIGDEASGGIGISFQTDIHRKNAELGYWLAEPFWGNGIITRAVVEMIHFTFYNYDIDRLYAKPFGTNLASQKVLEKAGFILEARFEKTLFKNGEYLDELIYAVRRSK